MRSFFTLLIALFLSGTIARAQAPVNILFIGNSFTAANSLNDIVRQFFEGAGLPAYTYAHAPGGISVGDVAMGPDAHMNNPAVFSLIRDTKWDYVVLQDNQGRFALDSAVFPSTSASKVIEGHLKIRDSLHFYHPCAKMVWFSGWGLKDDYLDWIDKIEVNYRVLNDSAKDVIAPIGTAWRSSIATKPAYDLWSPDGAHPDVTGSYLTAAVIFGTISGKDLMTNPFNFVLPPTDANYLKSIAQMTLTEPLVRRKSNIEGIQSESLRWDNPKLKAGPGKEQYRWYLGNKLQAITTDSAWTPVKSGTYRVWSRDALGQWQKSCAEAVTVTVGVNDPMLAEQLSTFPNPATETLSLANVASEVSLVEVYAMTGSRQLSLLHSGQDMNIDIRNLASGIYMIRCLDTEGRLVQPVARFVKQ